MASHRASSPRFVGRHPELEVMRRAFIDAAAGSPSTVLVGGEAGIGKTRIVRELLAQIDQPIHALYGACLPPADASPPYGPVREALRNLVREQDHSSLKALRAATAAELFSMVPELAEGEEGVSVPPESGYPQLRMFELFLNLLEHLAKEQPVVLVLEDLHSADPSTLALVAFLIHSLSDARILICVTYRHDELHRKHPLKPWLAEQLRCEGVSRLDLPRFSLKETADQVTAIMDAAPDSDVIEDLMARSEGNPFLTEELAAAFTRSESAELPGSLRDLLLDRFIRLEDDSQALLRVAAVGGRSIHPSLLAAVMDVPQGELYRLLRDAVDRHLLVVHPDAGTFSFRHTLLQEAIYSEVLPGESQNLHARYAEALEAIGNDGRVASEASAELAYHWDASQNAERALEASIAAAEWARSVFAFEDAQRYFERALSLWSAVPAAEGLTGLARTEVLARAGSCAGLAGNLARAATMLNAALAADDEDAHPLRMALWHQELAWCHFQNSSPDAERETEHALRLSAGAAETPQRAQILATAGRLFMVLGRKEARSLCEEAIELARRLGARREEGAALNPLGAVLAWDGELQEGIEALRKSLTIAEELGDVETIATGYINLGHLLGISGDLRGKAEISRVGREIARGIGLERTYGGFIRLNEAEALFDLGEWSAVRELLNEMERYRSPSTEALLLQLTARIDAHQGVTDSTQQHIRRLELMMRQGPYPEMARTGYEVLTELWILAKDIEKARESVDKGIRAVSGTAEAVFLGHLISLGLQIEGDAARLARAQRSAALEEDAIEAAHRLFALAVALVPNPLDPEKTGLPLVVPLAAVAKAELARAEGKDDPTLWSAASALWEQLDRPLEVAYSRWRESEAVVISGGARASAAPALRSAYEIVVRLEAAPLRGEIESLGRRARIDLDVQALDEKPAEHVEMTNTAGLTVRELEVLKLVADGLSNPQIGRELFISPKTASIHVSNILRKLGVSGRVEAAGVAHQLGLAGSASESN